MTFWLALSLLFSTSSAMADGVNGPQQKYKFECGFTSDTHTARIVGRLGLYDNESTVYGLVDELELRSPTGTKVFKNFNTLGTPSYELPKEKCRWKCAWYRPDDSVNPAATVIRQEVERVIEGAEIGSSLAESYNSPNSYPAYVIMQNGVEYRTLCQRTPIPVKP